MCVKALLLARTIVCTVTLLSATVCADAIVADHSVVAQFDDIPSAIIEDAATELRFYYAHTSHGSQIMTGLDMVEAENSLYAQPFFNEVGDDLGHNGDTSWIPATRSYLDLHSDISVAMWSWCGGCSDNTETGINTYLDVVNSLEQDYPGITFIYMTGHLDGTGPSGNLYARNNQIRDYCSNNDKILFDFADIESWNPDGSYYPDENDACGWCTDWCLSHTCPSCGGCAHSHCFNCYLKGKAFWWLMARLSGWSAPMSVDTEPAQPLPDEFALEQNYPNPFNPATVISFELLTLSEVRLDIFNLTGQKVKTLVDRHLKPDSYSFEWDAGDYASGVYLYRLQVDQRVQTRKMLLLK